jgi:hypothetical protein
MILGLCADAYYRAVVRLWLRYPMSAGIKGVCDAAHGRCLGVFWRCRVRGCDEAGVTWFRNLERGVR